MTSLFIYRVQDRTHVAARFQLRVHVSGPIVTESLLRSDSVMTYAAQLIASYPVGQNGRSE